jgi:hypothetical protein
MRVKEAREIIQVLNDVIAHINEHFEQRNYVCTIIKVELPVDKHCGYNTRMLPNALKYFTSQRPTRGMNKEFYYAVSYIRPATGNIWWDSFIGIAAISNMDRIRFLQHLIQKLEK